MNKEPIKHYQQFWGGKKINKKYLKKLIDFDFKKLIEKTDNGHRMIGSAKKLLSPSSILRPFKDFNLFGIPKDILEHKRLNGSALMENLEHIFKTKEHNINNLPITTKQKKDLFNIFTYFQEQGMKLLAVEKPITNGIVYGIVDAIVKWKHEYFVLEIKLRNNGTIMNEDRFQAKCYSYMLEIPALVLILADNGQVTLERINKADYSYLLQDMKKIYKQYGIELSFNQTIRI